MFYRNKDLISEAVGYLNGMWANLRMCQWVEPSAGAQGAGKDVVFFLETGIALGRLR
jgi:hypothetical protein